jgi:methylation protein EvaC
MSETICCAFCDSLQMSEVMDFGKVALAGGFLKPEQFEQELKFPLRLYFCHDCFAVQVIDNIPDEQLFKHYFYFSSSISTLREHFQEYANEITSRFLETKDATVLEFGCNDGVLLKPLAGQGIRTVIGVDPAENVISTIDDPSITKVNDFFTEIVAEDIVAEHGRVDIIMANNVYAHIPDIQGTTRAIARTLTDEGVFVFEVHYLGKVITELQYDMIYHEHLYYYSLLSAIKHFERYNMMVFDVKPVSIHGGSLRFYVCKNGSRHSTSVSKAVIMLEAEERTKCFDHYITFQSFSSIVAVHRLELITFLEKLRKQGHTIAGYGASGRANTIIQYCGINHDHLDYIIDDAPAKVGFYTPGSHFKICSNSLLNQPNYPDYILIFAWSFLNEIRKKNTNYLIKGGHMIVPLPKISIITQPHQ